MWYIKILNYFVHLKIISYFMSMIFQLENRHTHRWEWAPSIEQARTGHRYLGLWGQWYQKFFCRRWLFWGASLPSSQSVSSTNKVILLAKKKKKEKKIFCNWRRRVLRRKDLDINDNFVPKEDQMCPWILFFHET